MKRVLLIVGKAEDRAKSNRCKNRHDIAGQSLDIEWHVCLGDTCVQRLHRFRVFMSETQHEPGSFSRQDHVREHVQWHHKLGKRQRSSQMSSSIGRSSWLCCKVQTWLLIGVHVDGGWNNLSFRLVNKRVINKHPVFKCSNILQTRVLMRRRAGTATCPRSVLHAGQKCLQFCGIGRA